MRLEQVEYKKMLSNAIINNDIFNNLQQSIQKRSQKIDRIPKLDLGLEPKKLLIKLPLFNNLSQNELNQLAKLLKPKLAFPGEKLILKDTRGNKMYFISSGVLTVHVINTCFMLGSGDFFGELALITSHPRMADVIAKSYCELLSLDKKDFNDFLNKNPGLSKTIDKVAQERLAFDRS